MSRKIITFCVTIALLLMCASVAVAEEFDPGKTGSISVTLTEQTQNEPIVGAQLSVYYVATAVMEADGTLTYDYTRDFKACGIAMDDAALADRLDAFVSQHDLPFVTMTTNADGAALCDNLALGLYFVKQTGEVEGFAPCTSFLVTVPQTQDGGYVYEINASPKTEVAGFTSVTIKKVWNTDSSAKAADSVTVQLLRDGTVVKTATLNETNNWQITYTDMPLSDAYSVKEVDVPKGFTATYTQDGYVFTVTNTSTLIQTGQLIWPIPALAVCGMLFIAAGAVILQKKRKTNA